MKMQPGKAILSMLKPNVLKNVLYNPFGIIIVVLIFVVFSKTRVALLQLWLESYISSYFWTLLLISAKWTSLLKKDASRSNQCVTIKKGRKIHNIFLWQKLLVEQHKSWWTVGVLKSFNTQYCKYSIKWHRYFTKW